MKVLPYIFVLMLSGCITIEAPEHMVADTVDASKEAYHAIANAVSGDDNTYTYLYPVPDSESLDQASEKCVSLAVEEARKDLNVYNVIIGKATTSTSTKDGKSFLECKVSITTQETE